MPIRSWIFLVAGLCFRCTAPNASAPIAETASGPPSQMTPQAPMPALVPPNAPIDPAGPMPAAPQAGMAGPAMPAMPELPAQMMPLPSPATQPASAAPPESEKLDTPRITFVRFAVSSIDASLDFYVRLLGMEELRRSDLGNGTTEVFVGFSEAPGACGVLLVSSTDQNVALVHGNAYDRFGLTVSNIAALVMRLQGAGVRIVNSPTRTASLGLTYAIVQDPDAYRIEMIENDMPVSADLPRVGFVSFNILDETKTTDFYAILGIRKDGMYVVPGGPTELFFGFPDTRGETGLVLLSNPSRRGALDHGNAFSRFGVRVADLDATLEAFSSAGATIVEAPSRNEPLKLDRAMVQDPDSYTIELQQLD